MTFTRSLVLLFAAAAICNASTVDLTYAQLVQLNSRDTLSFELFPSSFKAAAAQLGLPSDPTLVSFCLASLPITDVAQFSATLRSADASIIVALGNILDFSSGYFMSAGFQGAVSTLQGQFHLDTQVSQDLFRSGAVWLDLTDLGGSVSLSLPDALLKNDLYVSLSDGPLNAGAIGGSVQLQQAETTFPARSFASAVAAPGVPEPGTWTMLAGAGALFAGRSALRRKC